MIRSSGIILLFLLCGLLASGAAGSRPGTTQNLCTIPLTRVLRIPVGVLAAQDTAKAPSAASTNLMISPGAEDELPEGPDGFDALDNGSLLITDPLQRRIVSFGSDGKFLKTWNIGFAADSLTVMANSMVLIREASTGRLHAFDREGQARNTEEATLPPGAEAQVQSGKNRGEIMRLASDGTHGSPLEIQFDKPGLVLVSLESLATDKKGDTYVALETTASGGSPDAINLNKYVRRYSSDGKLLCEIADIPLDYYVAPVDELRVRNGLIYQLQTTKSEVRVNVWDTNQLCSRPSH
jgi:hypothetical protein